jgi:hypothetical protein
MNAIIPRYPARLEVDEVRVDLYPERLEVHGRGVDQETREAPPDPERLEVHGKRRSVQRSEDALISLKRRTARVQPLMNYVVRQRRIEMGVPIVACAFNDIRPAVRGEQRCVPGAGRAGRVAPRLLSGDRSLALRSRPANASDSLTRAAT